MPLPSISHLQFFVLNALSANVHSGRFLRERLEEEGEARSPAAFYQLMARLEQAKLVNGWYESFVVKGQTIKERKYELTRAGHRILDEVRSFYSDSQCHVPTVEEQTLGSAHKGL